MLSDKIFAKAYEYYKNAKYSDMQCITHNNFWGLLVDDKKSFFSLINNFPLWEKNIMSFLVSTTNYLIQIFERLELDFDEVKKILSTENLIIENVYLEQGDRHHDKFVVKIKTNCGILFYKPRSSEVECAFIKIVDKFRRLEREILDIRMPNYYSTFTYSWVKGIEYKTVESREEEEKYYMRIGQQLAFFYLFDGNDMHFENVISEGEYPVPIDIETLFSTKLFLNKKEHSTFLRESSVNYSATSVKNIGFLPTYISFNDKSFDIGVVNIVEPDKANADKRKGHLHCAGNYFMNLDEIEEAIISGFAIVYRTFARNCDYLQKEIYNDIKNLKVRFLNRMTAEYAAIKDRILKPICFYNPQYAFAITARVFNAKCTPGVVERFEQKELMNLNIPHFKVKVSGRDLIIEEDKCIKDFFSKSPLELFEEKLKYIGESDFNYQVTIIKKMFAAKKGLKLQEVNYFMSPKVGNFYDLNLNQLNIKTECNKILKEIIKQACKNPVNGEHSWIEFQLAGDNYEVVSVPNNFYSGIFGILKVLVEINDSCMTKIFTEYVKEALKIIDKIINLDIKGTLTGAYDGIGVYINFIRDMNNANIIKDNQYEKYMHNLIHKCFEIYQDDKKIDILSGNAGLLLSLIHALEGKNSIELQKELLDIIKCVKNEIISHICVKDGCVYFPVEGRITVYFNGFAHGSAGIIVALYKAMKILNEFDNNLIKRLLDTQRKHFDEEKGSWYNDNKHTKASWGWCHGIPGILLSRLELVLNDYQDTRLEDEIEMLAKLCFENGLGFNTTFCHGDIAIITILEFAIEKGYCYALKEKIMRYKALLINNVLTKWDLGDIRGTEVVGLMDGLAGIAYFLACVEKKKIPIDVLTLIEEA